jgi:hypothetical protein
VRRTDYAGGRPDERFPRTPPTVSSGEGVKEVFVSVIATVNASRGEGEIRYVNPVAGGQLSGIELRSPVRLRVRNEVGEVLRDEPVALKMYTDPPPGADREGLVDAVIPVSIASRTVELLIGRKVAHTARIGGATPAVRAVQRVAQDEKGVDIQLSLDRRPDPSHTFSVQASTDGGRTWQTVAVGLREPLFAIDRRQFKEGQAVQVRVIVTNGLVSSVVLSEPFRV